jgi:NTP pyrophosphatase (non-canonical NTP hydrolase)
MSEIDPFKKIYENQHEFENFLIAKQWADKTLENFTDKERCKWCKELAFLLNMEIAEFINAVGNFKMHKTQPDVVDKKNAAEEFADIFIFAIDLALALGLDYDKVIEEIEKKQQKNLDRQKKGY